MRTRALYSVWRNTDDHVIIIDGTPEECAKAMGISVKSFFGTVSRVKSGVNRKWHIEVIYQGTKARPPRYAPKRVQAENIRKVNEYEARRRNANPELARARAREWYANNKDRVHEQRKKERARKREEANRIRTSFGDCERDAFVDLLEFLR